MATAHAWLLDFGPSMRAAIGIRELLQIIDAPVTFAVPLSPAYSRRVVFWQNRVLPVMDISARLGAAPTAGTLLILVGFQTGPEQAAQLGAMVLAAPPQKLLVNDQQAGSLPERAAGSSDGNGWQSLAISSFEQDGAQIPVLNLASVFAGA